VEQVNEDLAGDPKLGGSQLRRFLILPKELDADDGELTRTRKVKRRFIAERYASLLEALYGDQNRASVDMEIKFEDGRSGRLTADVEIHEAECRGPGEPAVAV
jgi:long-chain acyl-CoA synthetase